MEVFLLPVLCRLEGRSRRGKTTLVLTDTQIVLEPTPEFRAEIEEALAKGREGAATAPGVFGWIAEKAVGFATRAVDKVFEPHALADVELVLHHDRVVVRLGRYNIGSDLEVDPTEAYMFEAKFRDAKEALLRR